MRESLDALCTDTAVASVARACREFHVGCICAETTGGRDACGTSAHAAVCIYCYVYVTYVYYYVELMYTLDARANDGL